MLPELLAPAGSFDAALAAFAYGADAVYLGLSRFSARADATNFSDEELTQLVAYARTFPTPKKIYVTLNTLIETREREALLPALALLERLAIDGVIVQDLGLARLIHRHFPSIPLHASTQLACTSAAGARALKALGFVRIVTARELTLREAAKIGQDVGVEIEVFIHGALCYSLSGLCLFSSLTTGRSGNRGRCAYCCRQAFRVPGEESNTACHPFSMRDLALLEEGDALRTLPLASLKIEGRMKNPLYVAAVTDLYRWCLDGKLTPQEQAAKVEDLRTIFSRPWTTLYAHSEATPPEAIVDSLCVGHRGAPISKAQRVLRDVDGVRWLAFVTSRPLERHDGLQIDPPEGGRPIGFAVDRLRDARTKRSLITAPAGLQVEVALPREVGEIPRGATVYCSASQAVRRAFPVAMPRRTELQAHHPADLTLTLSPDAILLEGLGESVRTPAQLAPAKDPARSQEAAEKLLARLGEDGFWLRSLTFRNPQGLFLPASLLNATRRTWAAQAREALARKAERPLPTVLPAETPSAPETPAEPRFTYKFSVLQSPDLAQGTTGEIVVALTSESTFESTASWREAVPAERLRFALPVALRGEDLGPLAATLGALADRGFRRFECADLTSWQLLVDCQPCCDAFDITADWTWYATNPEAVELQAACGLSGSVTGPEANLPNLLTLPKSLRREVLVTQFAPLFIAYTRPLMQGNTLLDRQGNELRVTRLGRLWVTFNTRLWDCGMQDELLKSGFSRFRVDLSWAGDALPVRSLAELREAPTFPSHFAEPRL